MLHDYPSESRSDQAQAANRAWRGAVLIGNAIWSAVARSFWAAILCATLWGATAAANESVCYGTTSNGALENGVKLPVEGPNFVSYSRIAGLLGRTHVHSAVREMIVAAYSALERAQKGKVFKYAETGFRDGGPFKPHKTHQNGLSVDFMVPVIDDSNESAHLPTHAFNRLGYDIEFDKRGNFDGYRIDYEAMAAHIVELHKAAAERGYALWRVIFDPDMQQYLFATSYGAYLREKVEFSKRPSWVRHDEHYHVDFVVPCRKIAEAAQ